MRGKVKTCTEIAITVSDIFLIANTFRQKFHDQLFLSRPTLGFVAGRSEAIKAEMENITEPDKISQRWKEYIERIYMITRVNQRQTDSHWNKKLAFLKISKALCC